MIVKMTTLPSGLRVITAHIPIAAEVEVLGSQMNAYTSSDTTAFYISGLRSSLEMFSAIPSFVGPVTGDTRYLDKLMKGQVFRGEHGEWSKTPKNGT